jgi:hypothetical protein
VIEDDWLELCETLRDTAEGFASTDATNAWQYRAEADEFRARPQPADTDELLIREAEAQTLRQRWSERFRRRKRS